MPIIIDEVTAIVDPAPLASQSVPVGDSSSVPVSKQADPADLARTMAFIAQRKARLAAD